MFLEGLLVALADEGGLDLVADVFSEATFEEFGGYFAGAETGERGDFGEFAELFGELFADARFWDFDGDSFCAGASVFDGDGVVESRFVVCDGGFLCCHVCLEIKKRLLDVRSTDAPPSRSHCARYSTSGESVIVPGLGRMWKWWRGILVAGSRVGLGVTMQMQGRPGSCSRSYDQHT